MMSRREISHRYYETHKQEIATKRKSWDRKHKDRVNTSNRLWRQNHPGVFKLSRQKADHKHKYGELYERKVERLERQGFKCANPGCQTFDPGKQGWNTDHNHETNQIRGELCNGCNLALGFLNESLARIQGLADYIKQYTK